MQRDVTGGIFRAGDPKDLATQVLNILHAPEWARLQMGERAREWILRERHWPNLVVKYGEIYNCAQEFRTLTEKNVGRLGSTTLRS